VQSPVIGRPAIAILQVNGKTMSLTRRRFISLIEVRPLGHILYSGRVEKLKSEEGGVKSEQSFKISSHKTLVSC